MTERCGTDFEVGVVHDAGRTLLVVRGEVDLRTAPTLGLALDIVVDGSRQDVVLDLAQVPFMDASGLRVIVEAALRLASANGLLVLRGVSPSIGRLLELTRVSELVRFEDPLLRVDGPARSRPDHRAGAAATDERTSSRLTATASTNRRAIDAALQLITSLAGTVIDGAAGASVTLERDGRLSTVASTDETILRMDYHQYGSGEGPCLSAATEGRVFSIESLEDETRWPDFIPLAIEEGIGSVLSTPLLAADGPMGALNIYSTAERAFGPVQHELAGVFATEASAVLTAAGADTTDAARFADALRTREVIARAEGVLMAREHVSASAAAGSLYRSARTAKVSVAGRAADIVASTWRAIEAEDRRSGDG
jgi:anti-anti-sigma factor